MRTRDALRKSEEQFRFIAEHAGDLVAVLDTSGCSLRQASHARHLDPDAYAPGSAGWISSTPTTRERRATTWSWFPLRDSTRERTQLRMLSRSGVWHAMECQGNAVGTSGEGAQMVVLILRDIAARVHSESSCNSHER